MLSEDDVLLLAQSKRGKPTTPYSLNDKSTELLDVTAIDVSNNKPLFQENTTKH